MKNVLVVGASRGIGLEFVRQYRGASVAVTASARDAAGLARLRELGATAIALDITDESCASTLRKGSGDTHYDVVIVCSGIGSQVAALDAPSTEAFDLLMHTNVLGPMRVLSSMVDVLAAGGKIALLSSVMGAIGNRKQPNNWLYAASKAALNSVMKDSALALRGRAICVSVHPGWVRTDMGGANATVDVADSVGGMRKLLASLKAEDNGSFFDHQGESMNW